MSKAKAVVYICFVAACGGSKSLTATCERAETFSASLPGAAEPGAGPFGGDWVGFGEQILHTDTASAYGIDGIFPFTVTALDTELSFHFESTDCTLIAERSGSEVVFSPGQRCDENAVTAPSLPFTLCGGVGESPNLGVLTLHLEGVLDKASDHMWSGALYEILLVEAVPTEE